MSPQNRPSSCVNSGAYNLLEMTDEMSLMALDQLYGRKENH